MKTLEIHFLESTYQSDYMPSKDIFFVTEIADDKSSLSFDEVKNGKKQA